MGVQESLDETSKQELLFQSLSPFLILKLLPPSAFNLSPTHPTSASSQQSQPLSKIEVIGETLHQTGDSDDDQSEIPAAENSDDQLDGSAKERSNGTEPSVEEKVGLRPESKWYAGEGEEVLKEVASRYRPAPALCDAR